MFYQLICAESFFFLVFLQLTQSSEPKGTPVERNRISSSDYRKKNPERAKTSARLSNFRARARKKGLSNEKDIEDKVNQWEKEWQEKQAKEASEVCSQSLSLITPFPTFFTSICLHIPTLVSTPVCIILTMPTHNSTFRESYCLHSNKSTTKKKFEKMPDEANLEPRSLFRQQGPVVYNIWSTVFLLTFS